MIKGKREFWNKGAIGDRMQRSKEQRDTGSEEQRKDGMQTSKEQREMGCKEVRSKGRWEAWR